MTTTATEPQAALTPPELAKLLAVDPDRVRTWCKNGTIRAIDVSENPGTGKPRFRIMPDAIEEFLASRSVTPPPPRRQRRKKSARTYY